MKKNELKSMMWEGSFDKGREYIEEKLPKALNFLDCIETTIRVLFPEAEIDYQTEPSKDRMFVIANGKTLEIDVYEEVVKTENGSPYLKDGHFTRLR